MPKTIAPKTPTLTVADFTPGSGRNHPGAGSSPASPVFFAGKAAHITLAPDVAVGSAPDTAVTHMILRVKLHGGSTDTFRVTADAAGAKQIMAAFAAVPVTSKHGSGEAFANLLLPFALGATPKSYRGGGSRSGGTVTRDIATLIGHTADGRKLRPGETVNAPPAKVRTPRATTTTGPRGVKRIALAVPGDTPEDMERRRAQNDTVAASVDAVLNGAPAGS